MTSRRRPSLFQLNTDTMPKFTDLAEELDRSLSLEETYHLADRARRKSSDKLVREDLRLKLGHTNVLDSLLKDIAKRSPPPSPIQGTVRPHAVPMKRTTSNTITWAAQEVTKVHGVDDYGFTYSDDGEEDMESLSLCRTKSKRSER